MTSILRLIHTWGKARIPLPLPSNIPNPNPHIDIRVKSAAILYFYMTFKTPASMNDNLAIKICICCGWFTETTAHKAPNAFILSLRSYGWFETQSSNFACEHTMYMYDNSRKFVEHLPRWLLWANSPNPKRWKTYIHIWKFKRTYIIGSAPAQIDCWHSGLFAACEDVWRTFLCRFCARCTDAHACQPNRRGNWKPTYLVLFLFSSFSLRSPTNFAALFRFGMAEMKIGCRQQTADKDRRLSAGS